MAVRNVVHAEQKSQLRTGGVLTAFIYGLVANWEVKGDLVGIALRRLDKNEPDSIGYSDSDSDEFFREHVLPCSVMPLARFKLWQDALRKSCLAERIELDEQGELFAKSYEIDSSGYLPCVHLFLRGFQYPSYVAVPVPVKHNDLLDAPSLAPSLLKALKMEVKGRPTPVDYEFILMTLLAIDAGLASGTAEEPIYTQIKEVLSRMDPFTGDEEEELETIDTSRFTFTILDRLKQLWKTIIVLIWTGDSKTPWGERAREIRRSDEELRKADEALKKADEGRAEVKNNTCESGRCGLASWDLEYPIEKEKLFVWKAKSNKLVK